MWIEYGQLRQFRNYTNLELEGVPHKNLLIGENAAGKTNILEAIYFLSHGKSPRTNHDRELIQWNQSFATIKLQAHRVTHGGTVCVEARLVLSPENTLKTQFRVDGNPVKSRSEVVGKIPTVSFFLPDLLLLRGTPDDRRKALDSALVQYDPVHFKRLTLYNRLRQQKSRLLKQHYQHPVDFNLLESLNHQLAEAGADVMLNRMHYLMQQGALAELRYHELAQGGEAFGVEYQPSFAEPFEHPSRETLQQQLKAAIVAVQPEELRRGQVLIGPHRDDVRFFLSGKDASLFGSQGQQRSMVLAMKLAEIALLEQKLQGEPPILLLDDVMAELDPARQHQLLLHLNANTQVFLTTTHLDGGLEWFLSGSASVRVFSVQGGQVTPISKEARV